MCGLGGDQLKGSPGPHYPSNFRCTEQQCPAGQQRKLERHCGFDILCEDGVATGSLQTRFNPVGNRLHEGGRESNETFTGGYREIDPMDGVQGHLVALGVTFRIRIKLATWLVDQLPIQPPGQFYRAVH
jgi:hypothetical protein